MTNRRVFILRTTAAGALLALPLTRAAHTTNARSATAPLKILILGGTGFIGPHFVRCAVDRGHQVSVFNRGQAGADLSAQAERLIGDRNGDLQSIKNRDWDAVLDLATYVPSWVRSLGQALRNRVKHYLFISTVAAYEQTKAREPLHENRSLQSYGGRDDPYSLSSLTDIRQYGALKALCEREAETQFSDATLILRPGYIVGAGDPNGVVPYWLLRLSKDAEVLAVGDGSEPVQFIDVRDLAEWAIRLVERRVTGIFNTVGPAVPAQLDNLITAASQAVSTSPARVTWVPPAWFASQKTGLRWRTLLFFSHEPEGYGWMMQMNNERALAQGLVLRPMGDTLADIFGHYRKLSEADQAKLLRVSKKKENGTGSEFETVPWSVYLEREKAVLQAWHAQQN